MMRALDQTHRHLCRFLTSLTKPAVGARSDGWRASECQTPQDKEKRHALAR